MQSRDNGLTLGSLFDGIGGFPLAGIYAGITPVWASEIEPFPIRVTEKRFPDMKHYGDVSKLRGSDLEPVDVVTFGSPCFPEGTLVLTDKGYTDIEKIRVGMKVLTHMGRWRRVSAVGSKEGSTVKLRGNHYGLECTPNHPIYSTIPRRRFPTYENGKRGNIRTQENPKEWIPAEQMKGRLWAVPRRIDSLPINQPHYFGDYRENTMPEMNADFFYLVGRWIGDGWVRDRQRSDRPIGQKHGSIIICDGLDKREELEQTVSKVVNRYSVETCRTVVKVKFHGHAFCEWMTSNFGKYSYNKKLPAWVYGLPYDLRSAMFQGLMDTDGNEMAEGKLNYTTTSKKLAHGVRLLAETLGYSTTVHYNRVKPYCIIEGRTVHQRDNYAVRMCKSEKRHLYDENHSWYLVRDVIPTGKRKIVYNLTVEDDNSYVAEGIVVHNCQDLSIAGRREGLGGERSGLFRQAVRIISEMREKTNGKYPRWAVWENVPGALSSQNGRDFREVLESLIRIKDPAADVPMPEGGKWLPAGEILGNGYSLAWRIIDAAQGWGVAQRRKRIFAVLDLDGQCAGKVLFESEGMSGYTPPCTETRQRASRSIEEGAGKTGSGNRRIVLNDQGGERMDVTEEETTTLRASHGGHAPCIMEASGFCTEHSADSRGIGYEAERAPTLRAGVVPGIAIQFNPTDSRIKISEDGICQTLCSRMGTGGNQVPLTMEPFCKGTRPHSAEECQEWKNADVANTLNTFDVGETRCNELVVKAFGISSDQSNAMLSENPHAGIYEADTSRTLDCNGGNPCCNQGGIAVVEPVAFAQNQRDEIRELGGQSGTISASPGSHQQTYIAQQKNPAYCLQGSMIGRSDKNGPQGDGVNEEVAFTLDTVDRHAVYCMTTGSFTQVNEEMSPTIMARDYKDPHVVGKEEERPCRGMLASGKPQAGTLTAKASSEKAFLGNQEAFSGDYYVLEEMPTERDPAYALDRACFSAGENAQYRMNISEEKAPTLVAEGPGAVASPDVEYLVRRLTPGECCRLQGYPDGWCENLGTHSPSYSEIDRWTAIFEEYRQAMGGKTKPKTQKQIIKWLQDPHSDAAEYKAYGNSVAVPCVFFVLAGIVWAHGVNADESDQEHLL